MIRCWRGRDMLGRKERDQPELFITGSLRQLIPDDHVLVRVDGVLNLSWLREEVSEGYCFDDGRPGVDPEVAVRLMLAGLLTGIVHDRKLMREAKPDLARARACRPPWPRQYEDPGLPDSGLHQPQAAGCRSPCASSALDRELEHIRGSSHRFARLL
jgi:Transposase domain (DUF772)